MAKPEVDGSRWRARPLVAGTLVVAVFAIPVVCSVGAAALVGHLWAPAGGLGSALGRWVAILGISTLVFFGCERLTRRALPLTVLLKMGMVFPGRAPRRLSVARRSWTTRDLSRRIDEARHQGITDEPTVAAEQIVALAATLSAHDRRTRGHAERVRAFTDLIAEELRLPEDDRDRLRWSALLHDVGKLTVHTDILNKPGALSDPEWEQMRRHPLEGAKLTAPLAGWLGPWANTIAEHHERFDGLGYPFGLAGQEISTGGRIVAVADCYDTMTSLRSYKKPMPTEAARAELAACSGAQFDPIIVRAFLAVSVSRLHALAPLTWIASLPFGNLGPQLARLAAVGGRVGATGVVATVGVVGLTAGQQAVGSAALTPLSGTHRAGAGAPAPAGTTTGATVGPGRGGTGVGPARSGSSTHVGTGTRTTVSDGGGPQPTGSGKVGDDAGGADQAPAGPGGGGSHDGTTTTVASGTVSSTPTSTVGGSSPTTTTTTTSTTVPPPLPPGAVSAKSSCQLVILVPEVTLTWTASPTGAVTGYTILRSTSKTGPYSSVATVAGRTTVTYADTTASGLSTTYWYELESVAGSSSSSPTSAVSATTGALCL